MSTGPTLRRRKSAEDRRVEIIQTAIKLAAEQGPSRVTTQRLADAVGVTQPAIFRHFATKADIWAAVCQAILTNVDEAPQDEPEDPLDRFRNSIEHVMTRVELQPAIPMIMSSQELRAEVPSVGEAIRLAMDAWQVNVRRELGAAQDAGRLTDEADIERLAGHVIDIIAGVAVRVSIDDNGASLRQAVVDRVDHLLEPYVR